jgi:hypothetical protein
MPLRLPDGKRFAFTIIDDTDVATVANVAPMYRLLERLGMRTTKTVWPVGCPEGSADFSSSETMEDPAYKAFVVDLQRRGFEIASHGATMESSTRERTLRGLEEMRDTFGEYPSVHANHANNREGLYWGSARIDDPVVRAGYRMILGARDAFEGHVEQSPYWWGDVARTHIRFVRNLTFDTLDVTGINPTMPYHDPRRPIVNWWFSAADAENCAAFNHLLRYEEQERLERAGGIAIVATHLGKGFVSGGTVDSRTTRLLEAMSRREGWFVPVGQLLDWLVVSGNAGRLPAAEWRRMQWLWFADLLRRGVSDRARRFLRRARSGRAVQHAVRIY